MQKFNQVAAQGDVYFRRIASISSGMEEVKVDPSEPYLIVAHSETGHHHVMDKNKVSMFTNPNNPLQFFLEVKETVQLYHMRSHDTHDPITFNPGIYETRRQREHTSEGWRKVAD